MSEDLGRLLVFLTFSVGCLILLILLIAQNSH